MAEQINPFAMQAARVVPPPLPLKERGVRGKDVAKQKIEWKNVEKVYEFDDGYYLGYLGDPVDQATLGKLQGHCSGTHFIWTVEEKIWYFFALFDKDDVPHSTLHAKHASWINKKHPRDSFPKMPSVVLAKVGGSYGYPSFEDVRTCFKDNGLEYEPGKYCPVYYDSQTYDFNLTDTYYADRNTFAYKYGRGICVDKRPEEVDEALWDAYVKAAKAVEDAYDKASGAVKTVGRRFKFDGKWLVLLSASNKSQGSIGSGNYGKMIAEWLNSTTKKGK